MAENNRHIVCVVVVSSWPRQGNMHPLRIFANVGAVLLAVAATASLASADDFPTDRDLQASYCVGSLDASTALPGDPHLLIVCERAEITSGPI
jgi:hypothetical protein